ncbi:MAG: hypothetical protein HY726_20735 [Candidatus Rokubacteria bacterium]|nr:hypothetical protein [Candidatus Rokubacteria bacterium]
MRALKRPTPGPSASAAFRVAPTPPDGLGLPATRVAVAGLFLLTALFLWQRGSDVGRLPEVFPSFLASLVQTRLFGLRGAAESALGALVAVAVVLAWCGLGDIVVRLTERFPPESSAAKREARRSSALVWSRKVAFGAGLWSLLWFGLGIAGFYSKAVAVAALAGGLALAAAAGVRNRRAGGVRPGGGDHGERRRGGLERVALGCVAFPVLLALVAALAPPTGKDALIYHLAVPKAFVAAGGIVEVPYNIAGFFPLGAEMNGVWALLLGSLAGARVAEAAFGAVLFAFFPLLLALVYGWAREQGVGEGWALTVSALVAAIPAAYSVASSGYVDVALSVYVALAVHALGRWSTTASRASLVAFVLALGFALSVKPLAAFLVIFLPVVVLLRAWQAERRKSEAGAGPAPGPGGIVRDGLVALLGAAILGSPWYMRNWVLTGSPLFPFYLDVWKASAQGWDTERSVLFQVFLSLYGGDPKSVVHYVAAPVRLSLMAQPEQPAYYDGVLGISFLLGLPLLLWALWRLPLDAELRLAAAASGWLFVGWFFSSQQLRFLLPALPPLAVAIAGAAAAGTRSGLSGRTRSLQWTLLATTVAGHLVIVAWFLEQNPVRVVLGGEPRAAYLERRLDHYPYYRIVNTQLPPDARLWLINMRRDTYHLERPHLSDYAFEDYTLRKYVDTARDVGEVRDRVRAAGITHVLVRHDVLFDYGRSPIVDERRPREENDRRMALLRSFLLEGTRVLRGDRKFLLVELPGA